jgi:adenylylsulfate kinase
MIIQFIGLPGTGKTTIADALRDRINGLHLNVDDVRSSVNRDLGNAVADDIENARRLGEIARLLDRKQDKPVIIDMVAPTEEIRKSFGRADIVVWVDTLPNDGSVLWQDPQNYNHRIVVTGDSYHDSLPTRTFKIITDFKLFDWKADSTLLLGSYQNWGSESVKLYKDFEDRNKQTVIAIRHTQGMTQNDPRSFDEIRSEIAKDIPDAIVIKSPNFKTMVDHNDSGCIIEKEMED